MSKVKKILMFTSAILMILSGIITGVFCCIYIFTPAKLEPLIEKFLTPGRTKETVSTVVEVIISMITAGSVVGIVFGGISLRFCFYSSLDFYQKKSVVLTVAIICALVVNIFVGALYIVAVCIKDDNLTFEEEKPQPQELDVDKLMAKIEKLKMMREQDLINDDEFEKLKADILRGTSLEQKSE